MIAGHTRKQWIETGTRKCFVLASTNVKQESKYASDDYQ
jgi:hypothetical protein